MMGDVVAGPFERANEVAILDDGPIDGTDRVDRDHGATVISPTNNTGDASEVGLFNGGDHGTKLSENYPPP